MTGYVRQHGDWSARDGTLMDKTYPPEDWQRLGRVLQERRGQLGYGYRQRREFLRERGGLTPPSDKMLGRIEHGRRPYYPEGTIASLERLYGYAPGSFEAILAGREPEPLPVSTGGPLRVVAPPEGDDPDDEMTLTIIEALLAQRHKSAKMRLDEIWEVLDRERKRAAGPAERNGSTG